MDRALVVPPAPTGIEDAEGIERYARFIVAGVPALHVLRDARRYANNDAVSPAMRAVWRRARTLAKEVGR